ncbi:MFS transporter [Flavobacterium sp. FlaQc-48]|uniref:MFS transporter n=1 Tax=Flavobacterium sp. FlaQc-48 TaxID=3374181 RepID=UPI0037583139
MFKNYLDNYKNFPKEIWILTLITFINRAGTMVIPFLSKYMKENLHFTYNQIGWVMVFFGIGSMIGTWLSGKLSDLIGFYKVMLFSLFASGIVFFMLQYITTFEAFCAAILILTSIADMFRPAMLVSLNTYTKKENRIQALTLVRAAVNLGFLFGPALGGLLIMQVGYQYLFYVDGSTCILAILVFAIFVKEKKLPFKLKKHIIPEEKYTIIRDKPFLLHLGISMITGILFFQIFTTLPLYHKEQFLLSEFDSGLLLSMNGLLILLFELPIVNHMKRNKTDNIKIILLGLSLMSVSYFLLLIPWSGILIVMMLLMAFGVMFTFPFANSFAMSRAYKSQEGKYMAVFTISYSIAHILSTKTSMAIIQHYGYNSNWIFMGVLGSFGVLLCFTLQKMVKKEKIATKKKIINSLFKSNI